MMEFTTPPSYGSTVVNVGGVVKDGEIIYAGATNTAKHIEAAQDTENDWPEPKTAKFVWDGKTKDEKPFHAELDGSLGTRLDRVDVMAEVPGFIKAIAGSVAGTKPYIYQVSWRIISGLLLPHLLTLYQYHSRDELSLKVKAGDEETSEPGTLFMEATFIS